MTSNHPAPRDCLDDDTIALIAGGEGMAPSAKSDAIAHLSECEECRGRLAAVAHLLSDPAVASEVDQLDPPLGRAATGRRRYWIAAATVTAAAAVAVVMLGPDKFPGRSALTRDAVQISRDLVPSPAAQLRILSPTAIAESDSLRWTSVAEADLYRIRIWNRDGAVVWSGDTRDTALPLPQQLLRSGGSYLWEVKARTGWDRWVTSDFLELDVRGPAAPR